LTRCVGSAAQFFIAETNLPPVTKGRFMKTLEKYTAFDMAIALSAYDALVLD
jgi:hypothetical protein